MAEFVYGEREPEPEPALEPLEGEPRIAGRSPWALAARRLLRNRIAMAGLVLFVLIVIVSFAAPLYSHYIAHADPFASNLSGTVTIDGKTKPVVGSGGGGLGLGEVPIGPTWHLRYLLGADSQGRDVAARVLYGGRSSLTIGIVSALLACLAALLFGLLAGFYGGIIDAFLSRLMDLIWAFPLYLLAISLATVLLTQGLKIWVVNVTPGSLWIPILIIGVVYIPYVFRPVRGQVLSVREKEYIEAGVAAGASNARLMFSEILPNVASTIIVLLPLMIATTVLTEAALSYLSIGVQPPKASWGNIISDGQDLLYTRPMVAIAPGVMIVLTVLALNILGDGLRDALDPRAKVRA
jgi:peptide/nickel transport system permease protein